MSAAKPKKTTPGKRAHATAVKGTNGKPNGVRPSVAPTMPQSAAAPSPFPPIADYAFLANCHTGALVALDGTVDWLCVPRFDSPSVFGALLDRQAGGFRFGPFGINVPTARVYEPGTNTLHHLDHTHRLGGGARFAHARAHAG
jgi:hypothetical protein